MTEAVITIEDVQDMKVVHISGQLDESNIDEKIKEVYKIIEEVPQGLKLVFDLANLDYMNSKSIGYMTDLYGKISESGGKVAISSAKPNILDILQVVGLTQLIQAFDTLDEAKASIAGNTEAPAPTETPAPEAPQEATPAEPAPEAEEPKAAPAEAPTPEATATPAPSAPEATPQDQPPQQS